MVSFVGAPTRLEVIAIKFGRFSVVLHRETIMPGEVPVRNLGSPVRTTQIPKQAPQWPIPKPCKVSPNFQMSKMSGNGHTSFRNAFYMALHNVHVDSHTDHMDIAEWSCGFCIMVV
jgi:hypothetical protein